MKKGFKKVMGSERIIFNDEEQRRCVVYFPFGFSIRDFRSIIIFLCFLVKMDCLDSSNLTILIAYSLVHAEIVYPIKKERKFNFGGSSIRTV